MIGGIPSGPMGKVRNVARAAGLGKLRRYPLVTLWSGRACAQPVYRALHKATLRGRGFGLGEFADSGELALLQRMSGSDDQPTVIFDVGANVGGWSLEASRLFPGARVHAFEPSAAPFASLQSAVAGRNVTCVRAAMSDRLGSAVLHAVPGLPGLTSLHERDLSVQGLEMSLEETVETLSIDDYSRSAGIDRIDFLKIDVEGHELKVLHGATEMIESGSIQRLQFEFGGTNIDARTYLRDFVRLLEPRYSISRVLVDGLEPLHYSEAEEIFVTTNFYAEHRA